jgi:hypothetical protein
MDEKAKKAAQRQLLGMMKPESTDPEREVVGRWLVEDMVKGDTGLTLELKPGGESRLNNGVEGTWAIEDEQLVVKMVPFAAFFVTPGGDQMLGAWLLIEGRQAFPSSVALHRVK